MLKRFLRFILGSNLYWLQEIQAKYFPRKIDLIEKAHLKERELFYKGIIKTGETVFDVGANTGNRIAPLLNAGARVVAVEPQKNCYVYLERKFGNKIELVTLGLSDKEETRDFYISDATVFSSFSKDWIDSVKQKRLKKYRWGKPVPVKMTTLDNLINKYGKPAFIKIDVEGFELNVLKGLSKKIKMLSYEYMTPEQTANALKCMEHLETIDPALECNYCTGEEVQFKLTEWLGAGAMKALIASNEFKRSRFGDIYVRMHV